MTRSFHNEVDSIERRLLAFSQNRVALVGIRGADERKCLSRQIVDSLRRIQYVRAIDSRPIDPARLNPEDMLFDPLRGAILRLRSGQIDECFWLIFLATHFGRHHTDGWKLCRNIYGALGTQVWDWHAVRQNPNGLSNWIRANLDALSDPAVRGRFSNHRKYESIRQTPNVIDSYVGWVLQHGGSQNIILNAQRVAGQNPVDVFDHLYQSMPLFRFGRLGRFDFLTMLGKVGVAPIEPGTPYFMGATGPTAGARLLFDGQIDSATAVDQLERQAVELGQTCGWPMQVVEDSLCNWQKSPSVYELFK